MNKLFRALPYILLILNLLFIFGNSLMDGESSLAISTKAEQTIEQVVGKDIENHPDEVRFYGITFNVILRKCAHAVEFFTLGVIMCICVRHSDRKSGAFAVVLAALAVPLLDETVQLVRGRSAMVSDMWIDICGYAAGCVLFLAVGSIVNILFKKRQIK